MESLSAFAARAATSLLDDSPDLSPYLEQLEQELSQLRESIAPLGLVQLDSETGQVLSANEAFCRFVGYSEAELRGRPFAAVLHPDDGELGTNPAGPARTERRFIAKGGRTLWGVIALTPLRTPGGRRVVTGVISEITELKEAMAAAAAANRFLSAVLESSTQGVISVDVSGKITLVNLGAEQIFGYSRQELLGQPVDSLLPERFRAAHAAHQLGYFREPRNRSMGHGSELTGRRKDGSEFPAEITLSYVAGEHGPTVTVFVNDITARKRAQLAAEQAGDRFTAILNAASRVSVIATEVDGTIRIFNSGAERMLGYSAKEMAGVNTPLAFHLASEVRAREGRIRTETGDVAGGFDALVYAARHGGFDEREWTYVRKDRTRLTVNLAVTPVRDRQGTLTGFLGVATDITERKKHEAALRESEQRLRLFLEHAPAGIAVFDRDMRYLIANQRWMNDFELSADITGKSHYEMFPSLPEHYRDAHRRALAGEVVKSEGDREIRPDGSVRWSRWDCVPWRTADGEIGGVFLMEEDITAHKFQEEALRESEERLRLAADATGFGTFDFDPAQRTARWSSQAYQLMGIPEGTPVTDRLLVQRVHPDDRELFVNTMERALQPGAPPHADIEYRIVRPDGNVRWVRAVSRTWCSGEGDTRTPSRIVGTLTDITERKQAALLVEADLRRTDATLHTIVQAAPIAIGTLDGEGRVTSWNDGARRIFGYAEVEALGQVNPAIPQEDRAEFLAAVGEALQGRTVKLRARRIRKDGTEIVVSVSLAPLVGEAGQPGGAVFLAEDITDRVKAEADLTRIRSKLATAREDEARRIARELHDDVTQSLAVLSIDIGRQAASLTGEAAASLRGFQQRILDISEDVRGISHRMHPSILDDLGLHSALEGLCFDVARREGVAVHFHSRSVPPQLPSEVSSCVYRVAQEALHNAVKHAHAGVISVTLDSEADRLQLTIIDSGVGFDTDAVRSGLGLHSMSERAGLVSGELSVDSVVGEGTRVSLSVPLPAA